MQYFLASYSFVIGAIIGSFLNVVIWRLPREEGLGGRSHCPACGHTLGVLDLFPLLSFVFLGGRCRWCRSKISWRYFILELITGLLFVAAFYIYQPVGLSSVLLLLKSWLFLSALVVVFVIDFEHMLILDQVVFPVAAATLVFNFAIDFSAHIKILSWQSHTVSGLAGAAALFGLFFLVWSVSKGKWMGFGDVKLAVLLGLALGFPLTLAGLMLAVLSGGLVSLILLIFGGKSLKTQVPFGTFLAFGATIALFYGDKLLAWYLAILGF